MVINLKGIQDAWNRAAKRLKRDWSRVIQEMLRTCPIILRRPITLRRNRHRNYYTGVEMGLFKQRKCKAKWRR